MATNWLTDPFAAFFNAYLISNVEERKKYKCLFRSGSGVKMSGSGSGKFKILHMANLINY